MGRAPCCDKMGLKRGPWTSEEDEILVNFIHRNGHGNWRALPKQAGLLRCGKSCRLRWINYLRPDIKRGNFSPEEEEAIINLHQLLGNRWSTIASRLPGRTDNEIKNVWNTHLKKRLLRMGIDPVTHAVATHSTSPASQSLISLYNSEYRDASLAPPFPTQPKAAPDSPTTAFNLSDSIHDSPDLSSEIFSSVSSTESGTISADSDSRLDGIDSFEVEVDLGYDQKPQNIQDETIFLQNQDFADEERWFPRESQDATESEIMWEHSSPQDVHHFMPAYPQDDFSSMDSADANPQLLWNMDFQAYDDDTDYWLNILGQAASSPTLYQVEPFFHG